MIPVTTTHTPHRKQWPMFTLADEKLDSVPTPESFGLLIERLVDRYNLTYTEAIVELCEHYEREYESVRLLLTPKLKDTLAEEMAVKRMLKDNSFINNQLF